MDKNIKTLKVGRYSKKHQSLTNLCFVSALLLTVCLINFLMHIVLLDTFISFIITILILSAYVFGFHLIIDPHRKALMKFNKDLDFLSFENEINKLLQNNLHPDTRSYLLVLLANYAVMYDLDMSLELFNQAQYPKGKQYQFFYDLVAVTNAFNRKDLNDSIMLVENFKVKYPKKDKQILAFQRYISFKFFGHQIGNVEQLYPINSGLNVSRVINAEFLMLYYDAFNNLEKAKEYASYIVENAFGLKDYYSKAQEILNK